MSARSIYIDAIKPVVVAVAVAVAQPVSTPWSIEREDRLRARGFRAPGSPVVGEGVQVVQILLRQSGIGVGRGADVRSGGGYVFNPDTMLVI